MESNLLAIAEFNTEDNRDAKTTETPRLRALPWY